MASKVRSKYYREPQRESAMWARKHTPDLAAPLPGLGQQTLPATMPSIDFRLVWHTGGSSMLTHAAGCLACQACIVWVGDDTSLTCPD